VESRCFVFHTNRPTSQNKGHYNLKGRNHTDYITHRNIIRIKLIKDKDIKKQSESNKNSNKPFQLVFLAHEDDSPLVLISRTCEITNGYRNHTCKGE
jgi:hypothetical protein